MTGQGTEGPRAFLPRVVAEMSRVLVGQDSLVEKQLSALLQDTIWAPCGTCSLATRCPLKANADTLRDPASGAAVRERVRRLFEIVHLRRQ